MLSVKGVVLADQVKNLDWRVRKATRLCAVPDEVVVQVLRKLNVLLAGEPGKA
jgi:mRNA interferase MazF